MALLIVKPGHHGLVPIGEGAHICAASPGGVRYDPQQTSEERRSYDNGIWLCGTCHTKVDADPVTYSVSELRRIKSVAEAQARVSVSAVLHKLASITPVVLKLATRPLTEYCNAVLLDVLRERLQHETGDEEFPVYLPIDAVLSSWQPDPNVIGFYARGELADEVSFSPSPPEWELDYDDKVVSYVQKRLACVQQEQLKDTSFIFRVVVCHTTVHFLSRLNIFIFRCPDAGRSLDGSIYNPTATMETTEYMSARAKSAALDADPLAIAYRSFDRDDFTAMQHYLITQGSAFINAASDYAYVWTNYRSTVTAKNVAERWDNQIEAVQDWLSIHCAQTSEYNMSRCSSSLKHEVERWAQRAGFKASISNDAMKLALLSRGYRMKKENDNTDVGYHMSDKVYTNFKRRVCRCCELNSVIGMYAYW